MTNPREVLDTVLGRSAAILGDDMPSDEAKGYILLALKNAGLLLDVPEGYDTPEEWLAYVDMVSTRALKEEGIRARLNEPDKRPTLSVDFDGVLHRYSKGWQNGVIYDPPTDGAKIALIALCARYRLVISTVRSDLRAVWDWLRSWELDVYVSDVTNAKPIAVAYVDDRAVLYTGNWSVTVAHVDGIVAHHEKRAVS
ncbi:MAG: hypothetical protein ABW167_05170 [Baekduia sp.]